MKRYITFKKNAFEELVKYNENISNIRTMQMKSDDWYYISTVNGTKEIALTTDKRQFFEDFTSLHFKNI